MFELPAFAIAHGMRVFAYAGSRIVLWIRFEPVFAFEVAWVVVAFRFRVVRVITFFVVSSTLDHGGDCNDNRGFSLTNDGFLEDVIAGKQGGNTRDAKTMVKFTKVLARHYEFGFDVSAFVE